MSQNLERRRSYLAKLTAEFLNHQAGPKSLITVIDFELAKDGKTATVWLAIWPEHAAPGALAFVKRQLSDWHEFVAERTKFRPLPRLTLALDKDRKD